MQQNVTTLNLPRLTIKKLQNIGRNDCNDLTETVQSSLSIDLPKPLATTTGLELLEEELLSGCILSFNTELDKVLKDEIAPKRITELAGCPGSGKSQICFQLCVTTQVPRALGGLEGQVIYINTNKNFSSHRLRELTKKFLKQVEQAMPPTIEPLSEEGILKNVFVFNNSSMLELFATLKYLDFFLKDKSVKLLIVDSISSRLRDIESKERSVFIYKLLEGLQLLAVSFNLAIVLTNDFTTRIKDNKAYQTPSFADSFFDRVNSRICLAKSQTSNVYLAELVKSVTKTQTPLTTSFYMF